MNNSPIYITHAKRTATGTLMGALSNIPATRLGSLVIKSLLEDSKLDLKNINEVILGQVITGGAGQNPARQASIEAGLGIEIPAFTVNKVCGSGLKAVCLAAGSIVLGANEIVIAGGQENMSLAMHATYIRAGLKFGDSKMIDLMQHDGLVDAFSGQAMGITAENIAKKFNISRDQQDEFALQSHMKAAKAIESGHFVDEIIPVIIKAKNEEKIFIKDESIRANTNLEALAKLRTAFDPLGTVTAGNSSTINDGASALIVASEQAVKNNSLTPLVKIVSFASAGVEPDFMGAGPVPAVHKALKIAGWQVKDLDLIEVNEAFAASSIYVNQQMQWNPDIVNVNGGAIALGHPIGASGARILTTLIHQMKKSNAKRGLATMCIGGGMGIAMCVENV